MRKQLVAVIVGLASAGQALGVGSGGFTDQIVGSKALGMGNAFVATADDPSAIFFNPAGLTRQKNPALSIGLAPHMVSSEYTSDAGVKADLEKNIPVVPNLYGTFPIQEARWVLGVGIYSPFGLKTQWSDTGPLRYVATESSLQIIQINPTVAYRVNDRLSIGVGAVNARIKADLKARMNLSALNSSLTNTVTSSPDGNKQLSGTSDGWGYNIGVLCEPFENHSLGASYRSQIQTKIVGKTEFTNLSGAAAAVFGGDKYSVATETDMNLPQSLILGYAFKRGKWTLESDAEWVDYSSIIQNNFDFKGESNATRLSVLNTGNPVKKQWHSSWNFGAGANYQFNDTWQARAGYFHFTESVPEQTWDPSVPESPRNGFTFGGGWTRSAVTVDLTYCFLPFEKRVIHNSVGATSASTANGTYETTIHIVSVNLTYKFGGK
jgi:long-chain fatty acid transport protein